MNIKKFLVATLFIIPIILVMAVSTSAVLVSRRTPDNPTDIEVRDKYNKVVTEDSIIEVSILGDNDFLIINVFPEITKDKTLVFEIVEESQVGDVAFEKISYSKNRYRIIPIKVGPLEVIVYTFSNIQLKRKLKIHVVTNHVESINIINSERKVLSDNSLEYVEFYAGEKLSTEIFPASAYAPNSLEWFAKPSNVINIDGNGQITVLERACVTLTAGVYGIDGVYKDATVNLDFRQAIVKRDFAYVSDPIDPQWILDNLVFDEIKNEVSVEPDGEEFLVKYGNYEARVKLVQVEKNELGFIDNLKTIYTNNGSYRAIFGKKEEFEKIDYGSADLIDSKRVVFSSENANVLEIDKYTGNLHPLKAGESKIFVNYDGKQYEKEIIVRELLVFFDLNLSYIDEKKGIRQDRIWAKNFYNFGERYEIKNGQPVEVPIKERLNDIEITSSLPFGVKDDIGQFDLYWEVSNSSDVEITKINDDSNDVLIQFLDSSCGKIIKITAYMMVDNYPVQTMKRSFTFQIFDDKNAVNAYNFAHVKKAYDQKVKNLILQEDIIVELNVENGEMKPLGVYSNVWGNGYAFAGEEKTKKLYAHPMIEINAESGRGFLENGNVDVNDKFIFDDVVVKTVEDFQGERDLEYMCVGIFSSGMKIEQIFRYMQVHSCTYGMEVSQAGNLTFEGCLMGDNLYTNIFIRNLAGSHLDDIRVLIKNSIFKNSLAPSIAVAFDGLPHMSQAVGKNSLQPIFFEGDVRFYNWQSKESLENIVYSIFRMVLGVSSEKESGYIETLMEYVKPFWVAVMNSPEWKRIFRKYENKEYASMAIFVLGGVANNDKNNIKVGEEFSVLPIPFELQEAEFQGNLVKLLLSLLSQTTVELLPDNYIVGYDFEKFSPEFNPNDPVPASQSLYHSLIGEKVADYEN